MIRKSLIRGFHLRSRAVVVIATMLVVFWNGLPALGCVCADGHFKPFCSAANAHRMKLGAATLPGSCGCECRAKVDADHTRASCCGSGSDDCCAPSTCHDVTTHGGLGGKKSCCTPVLKTQAVSPATVVDPRGSDQVQLLCDGKCLTNSWTTPIYLTTAVAALDTGPPPTDLVVTLRRFVI